MFECLHIFLEVGGAGIYLVESRLIVQQRADCALTGIHLTGDGAQVAGGLVDILDGLLRAIQKRIGLLQQGIELGGRLAGDGVAILHAGRAFGSKDTSIYRSPTKPSEAIAATESFLTTVRVRWLRFSTTRTFWSG